MPFDGNGNYVAPSNSWNPAVGGTTIDSADWNSTQSDYETALSSVITKDGQTTITANLPMSGFKHTGVNPNSGSTSRTEYTSGGTVQDNVIMDAGVTAGSSTVYTATLSPAITAYADKACYRVQFDEACGNNPTINFNAVGARKLYQMVTGSAVQLVANDVLANQVWHLRYDSTLDTGTGGFILMNYAATFSISGLTETTTVDEYNDFLPIYDASATANRKVRPDYILGLMSGHLYGLTLSNNGSDVTNDIDIAVGSAVDASTGVYIKLASGLTKQLDAAWAVGTNQGMRATGAAIANTTYHIFIIMRPDTGVVDIAADTSVTGANIAANTNVAYTVKRRIGTIVRSGGAIKEFSQSGDTFLWKTSSEDFDVSASTTAATVTLNNIPTGIVVSPMINVLNATGSIYYLFTSLSVNDQAAGTSAPYGQLIENAANFSRSIDGRPLLTNTSAQIRVRASGSGGIKGSTLGYIDRRGKDGGS